MSKLCGELVGKDVKTVMNMGLDDIKRILSVDTINPSRVKCATIGLDAVKKALSKK